MSMAYPGRIRELKANEKSHENRIRQKKDKKLKKNPAKEVGQEAKTSLNDLYQRFRNVFASRSQFVISHFIWNR